MKNNFFIFHHMPSAIGRAEFVMAAIFRYAVVLGLSALCSKYSNAQPISELKMVVGKITDSENGAILPYAHVYNSGNYKGTVSDLNGEFEIPYLSNQDTFIFSYMGYDTRRISLKSLLSNREVKLVPTAALLNQVTILADNTILYNLIGDCKKNHQTAALSAKTYYQLTTTVKNKKTEFIEGYYNGTTKGYSMEKLELKNGRLYLRPLEDKYFVSTESSWLFTNHSILSTNAYFPHAPFEFTKRSLSKKYELRLIKRYLTNENHSMYVIQFKPKKDENAFFEGEVWIDSTASCVRKISLNRLNASRHPFDPIWSSDQLSSVNLHITKTYELLDGVIRIKQIDFLYDLNYVNRAGENYLMQSKALLFPYDYSSIFQLPLFIHSSSVHGDYRKISAVPYNDLFWQNTREFRMNNEKIKEEVFNDSLRTLTNLRLFALNEKNQSGFFEQPYVKWSEKRIGIKAQDGNTQQQSGNLNYDLVAQIYMDINKYSDTLAVLSATIFDPFLSYYTTEINNRVNCFINLYFDIMEIERRKIVKEIHQIATTEYEAVEIYQASMKEVDQISTNYFNEVRKGNNLNMLRKWNNYVLDQLNIDNMKLFGISETPD